jgi:hypothetical protein
VHAQRLSAEGAVIVAENNVKNVEDQLKALLSLLEIANVVDSAPFPPMLRS